MMQPKIRNLENNIIYEDSEMIVVRKPSGIAVQSARFGQMDLESALKNYLVRQQHTGEDGIPYLGVVHRLDQPVEGLVIFGKTKEAARGLSRQLTEGTMDKYYLAIVESQDVPEEGTLEHYLVKDGKGNYSRVAERTEKNAKRALLNYRLLEQKKNRALVEIKLLTGRHHQIRVQMAYAGMPLAGDKKYNVKAEDEALALCAYKLQCMHPVTGNRLSFQIPKNELGGYYRD